MPASADRPAPRRPATRGLQRSAFLLVLAAVSLGFLYLVRDFLLIIFMAAIFTGLTHPLFLRLKGWCRGRSMPAALLTLLLLILILVVPVALLAGVAYQQALDAVGNVNPARLQAKILGLVEIARRHFPAAMQRYQPQDLSGLALNAGNRAAQWLFRFTASMSFAFLGDMVNFFLMLFTMFYLYLDGPRILARIIQLSPLKDRWENDLLAKFLSVTKGTLKGHLIIGAIQGVAGGALFALVRVGSPVFLGGLMLLASFLPAVGVGLVWVPVAVFLAVTGRWIAALIVFGVCAIVISSIDNILRPMIVGKDIQMNDLMVLFSTLGGIAVFGLPGFIVGPVIASLFVSVWEFFGDLYAEELEGNKEG